MRDVAKIEFIPEPYTLGNIPSVAKLKLLLKTRVSIYGLYFLCVEPGGKHCLEILEGVQLLKRIYKDKIFRVIGIAEGKTRAFELLKNIISKFVAANGDINALYEYMHSIGDGIID